MAVLALYAEGGFEMAEDFRELPDHVAAELEFLYLLMFRERQARRSGDAEALARRPRCAGVSSASTSGRWVGPFTAAARSSARTAFYRELAALTGRFVRIESRRSRAG